MKEIAEQLIWWWDERTERLYKYYVTEGKNEYAALRFAAAETIPSHLTFEDYQWIWGQVNLIDSTYSCWLSTTTSVIDWLDIGLVTDDVIRQAAIDIKAKYTRG